MRRLRSPSASFALALALSWATGAGAANPQFANPPELVSKGGELSLDLKAASATITVANQTVDSVVWNGLYVPPVLRLQQGDTLKIHQINNSPWDLNVHTHGLTTTPLLNGDNVFVVVDPNSTFDTEIPIPMEHPSGMFWFHPHVHGFVNNAISHGLSGAMIIGDILAPFPELAGITERVMVLKDLKVRKGQVVDDPDPSGKTLRTINGLFKPDIAIAPGELQFWRIANASANIFYKLKLGGGVMFNIIAVDGNLQNQIVAQRVITLPPGTRIEALVRGPKKGRYKFVAQAFNTGKTGDHYPEQRMGTLISSGAVMDQIPLPTKFPSVPDLREETVDKSRTVVFDDTDDPNVFVIDGKVYDRDVVNQTVQLGDLEEWTLENASQEFHVFHIHQGDFQVVSINGVEQPFTGYQDTVNLPVYTKKGGNGSVVMRMRFDPPIIVGEYVYHCHIVQHEDQGMMANVEVVDELAKAMQSKEPDLIADALTPATGNYWCR